MVEPLGRRVTGFLVPAGTGELRTLIVSCEIVVFLPEQILDVVELDLPEGITSASGVRPVAIELADSAPVAGSTPREAPVGGALPFAFAVRDTRASTFECPRFRELEREFMHRHDLRP